MLNIRSVQTGLADCQVHSIIECENYSKQLSETLLHSSANYQWRRQRSKGARSFRGQKIIKPGQITHSPGRCEGLAWPSGVANWGGGGACLLFLHFPFSFPPLPFPFSPLPIPSLPLEVGPLKSTGERCKQPQWPSGVWSGAPTEIEFGALNCSFKMWDLVASWQQFQLFSWELTDHTITEAKQ